MAKILWQREVDARHDLAVAVMRLSDAPDAMYDHLIPTGPDMKAPRWRTNMCGSESEAIDLLRIARDSLEHHVAKDPEMNSVLRWYYAPKWKFGQRRNPGHTVLSLACTGPQASDFVRNEPALLGACVAGCLEAYGEGHIFGGMIHTAYAIASTRILRLWLTSLHVEPEYRTSNCHYIRGLLYESWRRVVFNARAQVGESDGGFWYPIIEPRDNESEIISNLRTIYTRGCVFNGTNTEVYQSEITLYPYDHPKNWKVFARSCFNWTNAIVDAQQICSVRGGDKTLRLDVWHEPGPCGVEWLDKIVADLPAP